VMTSIPNLNGRESRIFPAYLGDFVISIKANPIFAISSFTSSCVCVERDFHHFPVKLKISSRSTSSYILGVKLSPCFVGKIKVALVYIIICQNTAQENENQRQNCFHLPLLPFIRSHDSPTYSIFSRRPGNPSMVSHHKRSVLWRSQLCSRGWHWIQRYHKWPRCDSCI
jgi:hypothetical protein